MTIADLRALAAFHLLSAENNFRAANGMGSCPASEEFTKKGAQHMRWAEALSSLADAFQTFSSVK